jgi:CRP/FNR family transcriptional regulator, cyclic AMP receptor protein
VGDSGDVIEADQTPDLPLTGEPPPLSAEQTLALMARVNIFSALPPIYLRRIAGIGLTEVHARGTRIFTEGTPGDKVYIILEGAVRISRQVSGMEETLAVLKIGDYFGEMALIDDFPRSADALAHERCRLFVITKDHLADLLFVDRDLAYDLLWTFVRTLAARLRETNDRMSFLSVAAKF